MKKLMAAFAGLMMMVASATSYGTQSHGWRLNVVDTLDGAVPVVISEIEYLDDTSPAVDTTQGDLGVATCGWTCDSISSNERGSSTVIFNPPFRTSTNPNRSSTRSNRQVGVTLDNNPASYFTTRDDISAVNNYFVQYTVYRGVVAPPTGPRDAPLNVTTYAVTVPVNTTSTDPDVLGTLLPGVPNAWTVEYFNDASSSWVVKDIKSPDTTSTEVDWSLAVNVYSNTVDSVTTFYLSTGSDVQTLILDTDSDWSAPLEGTALTDALALIAADALLIAKRLEFTF